MNFFESQEAARRKTRILLVHYALAVILIVCAFYLASRYLFQLACVLALDDDQVRAGIERGATIRVFAWNPLWFFCTACMTSVVVLLGMLWRQASLEEGGAAVARSSGGREIQANTQEFYERRLLNIVEEIALASGIPVPRVFVLAQEPGVNAFAAGFSPNDAAVAVTQGAMEQLTRDELQGVIAHEFSHILNGDMRLNCWLIGLLFGILVLSISGKTLMRMIGDMNWSDSRGGGAALVLLAFVCGLLLWGIGSVGVFFARLIQCSVSRERESLADASAVQFTRNPVGLASALKRIGASPYKNALRCANRDELSHLLFSSGSASGVSDLFASHPPILQRIRLLDPAFDGNFAPWRIPTLTFEDVRNTPERIGLREAGVLMELGGAELMQASAFLHELSPELRRAVSHPIDAAGVLFGLLLSDDVAVRQRQRGRMLAIEGQSVVTAAEKWHIQLQTADRRYRRMVAELAIEGLRQRDPAPRAACVRFIRELIDADGEVSLFEYMLEQRIARRLSPLSGGVATGMRAIAAAQAQIEASLILGTLAYAGQPDDDGRARAAWQAGSEKMAAFNLGDLVPVRSACTLDAFDRAMSRLNALTPGAKGELIAGCMAVVGADGQWTADETELLRAAADMLDMPLPQMPGLLSVET